MNNSNYQVLHIDDIEFKTYSGGEFIFNVGLLKNKPIKVYAKIYNSEMIIKTLLVLNAIESQGINKNNITLCIPYFPYARQDRLQNLGEAIGYNVIKDLFKNYKISTLSLHADLSTIEDTNIKSTTFKFNFDNKIYDKSCKVLWITHITYGIWSG